MPKSASAKATADLAGAFGEGGHRLRFRSGPTVPRYSQPRCLRTSRTDERQPIWTDQDPARTDPRKAARTDLRQAARTDERQLAWTDQRQSVRTSRTDQRQKFSTLYQLHLTATPLTRPTAGAKTSRGDVAVCFADRPINASTPRPMPAPIAPKTTAPYAY